MLKNTRIFSNKRRTLRLLHNTNVLVILYALNIFLCSIVYWVMYYINKSSFSYNGELSFIDFLYFSIVTATTLGYGDIYPVAFYAQAIVVVEVLLAISMLGFLISAIWQKNQRENYPDIHTEEFMLFATQEYRRNIIQNIQMVFHILDYDLRDLSQLEWLTPPQGLPTPRAPDLSKYRFVGSDKYDDFYKRMIFSRKYNSTDKKHELAELCKCLFELKKLLANVQYLEHMSKLWPEQSYAELVK